MCGTQKENGRQCVDWHACFSWDCIYVCVCVCVCVCTSFVMIALSLSPGGQATPLNLRVFANPQSPEDMAFSWATERARAPVHHWHNQYPN